MGSFKRHFIQVWFISILMRSKCALCKLFTSWNPKQSCQDLVISCYNSILGFEKCTFLRTHGNRWPSGNDIINTFHLFKLSLWCFTYTSLWRNHFILVFQVPCVLSGMFKKINRKVEGDHPLGYMIWEETIWFHQQIQSFMKNLGIYITDQIRLQSVYFSFPFRNW